MQKDLLYSKSHEWARVEDEIAVVGITDFAQEQLGDITFVELPAVGDTVSLGFAADALSLALPPA